ncbi:MAG: hypothetical protein E7080_10465 [Bacteroidales bacterium]|nr:hypothetical protein [Bacteroidales bacterium]
MKEATLTSAHVAESFQPVIDWKALKSNVNIIVRKSLTILRNSSTPWVLTAIATIVMLYGYAIGSDMLHKWSAVASIFPFSWALFREFKNTNTDEL